MINTVLFPVAGLGTRLLPATKSTPKELLPIFDTPAIQFAINEAIEAGAQRLVFITHPEKDSILKYLARDSDGIASLREKGKNALADTLNATGVPDGTEIALVLQTERLGLGHAIMLGANHVLDGPVGVILPDDVILGASCLAEMAQGYSGGHMIAAMEVPEDEVSKYGIFSPIGERMGRMQRADAIIEKPDPSEAPSRLAAVGRYILDPSIFRTLKKIPKGAGGEYQLTDAIAQSADIVGLTAYHFTGTRFDTGNHEGLLLAAQERYRLLNL
ncbi:UTP--glucose-1-phosphate uridylyltransferase [Maritimibacter sp. DP1N21-5]|uniref:UTP--glucose-1-phosphate uridylyltransferase n=1 Tax=Maritimibacter sp. DP1N21-5 TaxID=2836867 RepID=UPI001C458BDD|nr:sugar phosphate nucleotidyltransferase [Maritimibacter sp. DP1N21-5]MBV7409295.1 UTP--glucose-1-phosphate uridylyltransferase [Maritimibacter sp. DP1N21-5]